MGRVVIAFIKYDRHQIKVILFDLDGVLVNSYEAWFRLFNDTLKHFGYRTVTRKEFNREWGKSTKEDVKYFMPDQTVRQVRTYYSKSFPRFVHLVKATSGARTVLGKLKKMGFKLVCVTNSHADITDQMMRQTKIRDFFEITICADHVKRPKPAPDMLKRAMRLMTVKPREVLFVGDTRTDLIAGKRARCWTIGYKVRTSCSIDSLQELLQIKRLLRAFKF